MTSQRFLPLDLARTAALFGMVIFHFTYDLEMFGYITPGTMFLWGWQAFATVIAGSFLFLAGFSLSLVHGAGINWPKAARRLLILGGAAALITTATYFAMPESFIFFGILHSITAASVVGFALLALRVPASLILLSGVAVLAATRWLKTTALDAPWLLWLGLGTQPRQSLDYEPLFPWLAPFLFGLALAKLAINFGLFTPRTVSRPIPAKPLRLLAWPGKHSLAIYLIHQPILIGLMWAATQVIR